MFTISKTTALHPDTVRLWWLIMGPWGNERDKVLGRK